jgi:hypothetical protein
VTFGHAVPLLDADFLHDPRDRRGHIHRRLVGLQRRDRVIDLERAAHRAKELNDRDVLVIAYVRHLDFNHGTGRRSGGNGRRGGGNRRRRCRGRRGNRRSSKACGLDHDHRGALANAIAHLDLDLLDHTRHGRGHFHGGLVRFQRQQRILQRDRVADLDEDLDDRNILEIPDIGDLDFDKLTHFCP